jgi:hypothetical protein
MLLPQWGGIDPAFQESLAGKARDALERQVASAFILKPHSFILQSLDGDIRKT